MDRFLYSRFWVSDIRTDPEGWVVVDPAPLEPVTFSTWAKGLSQEDVLRDTGQDYEELSRRRITLVPVQLPAGQTEAEFTLRLPLDRK